MKCKCFKKNKKGSEKNESAKGAFAAFITVGNDTDWYIDSGAFSHMTHNKKLLYNMEPSNKNEIVSANNGKMKVRTAGDAKLLFVPDLVANWLSVNKICEKGNTVLFSKNECIIKNQKNRILATCKASNGVYKFNGKVDTCTLAKQNMNALSWHRLKKMRDITTTSVKFDDDENDIARCQVCAEAKQHSERFENTKNASEKILELIHSDVVGPMDKIHRKSKIHTHVHR